MIGFDRRRAGLAVSAGMMAALMSSGAWAQNCTITQTGPVAIFNPGTTPTVGFAPGAAGAAIANAIGNANTAFLSNQGSAFVSAPANPAPNQEGGGVWVRGVGGEVTIQNTSTSVAVTSVPQTGGVPVNTTTTNCNSSSRQEFAGGQMGADIARLNWNGWNVHLGTTAGFLNSTARDSYGFNNNFDVPFIGTYLVATYGRFFADLQVRNDYYNITLNNPGLSFFSQPVGAHGYSVSTSAGYNFALQNNWFIEPSAGFIYSRTKVDDFTNSNPSPAIGGTITTGDITSEIGRLSVRVGTTIATPNVVWQPFASASVFHEFGSNVSNGFTTFPNNFFLVNAAGVTSASLAQTTSTNRVGTYGQYSLGLAGQIVNSGWLGFVRVDYRNGDRIEGYTGNVGLRYQFTPEMIAAVMPVKVPVKAPRMGYGPTNWTGFYVGGFFGADEGRTNVGFAGTPAVARPYVFGPIGGGQVGYNWQTPSNWVFGVEGDIGAGDIRGARQCGTATGLSAGGAPVGFSPVYYTCRDRSDWVGTATARIGYSWGRTLYYVRGGGAWEDAKESANCILGTATGVLADGSRACRNQVGVITPNPAYSYTRTGYLIGFGTEFDLGRGWSAKTEYNYLDFGRRTQTASDGTTVLTDRSYSSQVKVGVNYRFGPGAVVAKY